MTTTRSSRIVLAAAVSTLLLPVSAAAQQVALAYNPAAQAAAPVVAEVGWPTLNRPVERGRVLSLQDFSTTSIPARAATALAPVETLIGKAASRSLQAGALLRSGDVMDPQMVYRGSIVTVNVRMGGILITSSGRALNDAEFGMPVRVLSSVSNRTLDAVAEGPGAVQLVGL